MSDSKDSENLDQQQSADQTEVEQPDDAPLFTSLDFHSSGHRLTGDGLRKIALTKFAHKNSRIS